MFAEAGVPHHLAHGHAYFHGESAVFSIDPVELIADWKRLLAGRVAVPIEPLNKMGVMGHMICHVREFEIVAPYTLRVLFTDASEQVIDFEPVLRGELYGPLRDLALFNRVALDRDAQTLVLRPREQVRYKGAAKAARKLKLAPQWNTTMRSRD